MDLSSRLICLLVFGITTEYLLGADALCNAIPYCKSCPLNADKVPICEECHIGFGLFYDTGNPYLTDGRPCQPCRELDGCWLCKNSSYCDLCKLSTTGPDKQGVGTCSSCIENCRSCKESGGGNCDRCASGYFYDAINNKCLKCGQNCDLCDRSKEGKCDVCLKGYFMDSDGKCQACIENCDHCAGPLFCKRCSKGYYVSTSAGCNKCIENCELCANAKTCKVCAFGFHKDGSDGCIPCDESCAYCERDRDGKCLACKNGRIPPPSGKCGDVES